MYDMGHPLTDAEFERARELLDTNGDGKLSYSEFKAWWMKADRFEMLKIADEHEDPEYAQWMEGAVQHFGFFDKDRSGGIDATEFADLWENLKTHGYPVGGSAGESMAAMDADGDGEVTLTEYCRWLTEIKYGRGGGSA